MVASDQQMRDDLRETLTEPHINNWVVRPFLVYFRELAGKDFITEVLDEVGLPESHFAVDGWVSATFVERFTLGVIRRLEGLTHMPPHEHPVWQHWRRVGWIGMRRDLIGPMWHVARVVGSPGLFYRQVPEQVRRANHMSEVELVSRGPGICVLRFSAKAGTPRDLPAYCWNRIGVLQAVPTVWGLPIATVDHRECMHHPHAPAEACVYHVRFRERRTAAWVAAAAVVGGGLAAGAVAASVMGMPGELPWMTLLGGSLGTAAVGWRRYATTAAAYRDYAGKLSETLNQADSRYDQLWEERLSLRRASLINRKIAGYLAHDLVEQIMANPDMETTLGGVRTHAAVLFADVVGFTPRCEGRDPQEVVEELNIYFGEVDAVIDRCGGIIDKRMGDGIMVVFTSSADEDAGAVKARALRCGLGILQALPACNAKLAERGSAPLCIRVGLAAGPLVLGNMGSKVKLEYTVIGEVVNLAARLESAATPGHLLVPRAEFLDSVDAGAVSDRRTISVKGLGRPVEVLELAPLPNRETADPASALVPPPPSA